MIQLRITTMEEIIKKEITVVQVAKELAVTKKTVHHWLARYKKRWEQWLYPKKPWPKNGSPPNRIPIRIERMVNGSEFSRKFTEYLESIDIKHIQNTTYTPKENGKRERYHRTWKDEDINYRSYGMSLDEANYRNITTITKENRDD